MNTPKSVRVSCARMFFVLENHISGITRNNVRNAFRAFSLHSFWRGPFVYCIPPSSFHCRYTATNFVLLLQRIRHGRINGYLLCNKVFEHHRRMISDHRPCDTDAHFLYFSCFITWAHYSPVRYKSTGKYLAVLIPVCEKRIWNGSRLAVYNKNITERAWKLKS